MSKRLKIEEQRDRPIVVGHGKLDQEINRTTGIATGSLSKVELTTFGIIGACNRELPAGGGILNSHKGFKEKRISGKEALILRQLDDNLKGLWALLEIVSTNRQSDEIGNEVILRKDLEKVRARVLDSISAKVGTRRAENRSLVGRRAKACSDTKKEAAIKTRTKTRSAHERAIVTLALVGADLGMAFDTQMQLDTQLAVSRLKKGARPHLQNQIIGKRLLRHRRIGLSSRERSEPAEQEAKNGEA